jgi:hypothetical protein
VARCLALRDDLGQRPVCQRSLMERFFRRHLHMA